MAGEQLQAGTSTPAGAGQVAGQDAASAASSTTKKTTTAPGKTLNEVIIPTHIDPVTKQAAPEVRHNVDNTYSVRGSTIKYKTLHDANEASAKAAGLRPDAAQIAAKALNVTEAPAGPAADTNADPKLRALVAQAATGEASTAQIRMYLQDNPTSSRGAFGSWVQKQINERYQAVNQLRGQEQFKARIATGDLADDAVYVPDTTSRDGYQTIAKNVWDELPNNIQAAFRSGWTAGQSALNALNTQVEKAQVAQNMIKLHGSVEQFVNTALKAGTPTQDIYKTVIDAGYTQQDFNALVQQYRISNTAGVVTNNQVSAEAAVKAGITKNQWTTAGYDEKVWDRAYNWANMTDEQQFNAVTNPASPYFDAEFASHIPPNSKFVGKTADGLYQFSASPAAVDTGPAEVATTVSAALAKYYSGKDAATGLESYKVQQFIQENPSQESINALRAAGFDDATINAAQEYVRNADATKLSVIPAILDRTSKSSGAVTALIDAISNAGYYTPGLEDSYIDVRTGVWFDSAGNILDDVGMAKLQWDHLTSAQKDQVAGLLASDPYKGNYMAEVTKIMGHTAEEAGIVGQLAYAPILPILQPIAKATTGQQVSGMEIAQGVAVAALDALGLGVLDALALTPTATKIIAGTIMGTSAGVFAPATAETLRNPEATTSQKVLAVVGELGLILGVASTAGLKLSSPVGRTSVPLKEVVPSKVVVEAASKANSVLDAASAEASRASIPARVVADVTTTVKAVPKTTEAVITNVNSALENINKAADYVMSGQGVEAVRSGVQTSLETVRTNATELARSTARTYETVIKGMNDLVEPLNVTIDKLLSGELTRATGVKLQELSGSVKVQINRAIQLAGRGTETTITRVNNALENLNTLADYIMSGRASADVRASVRSAVTEIKQATAALGQELSRDYELTIQRMNGAVEVLNTLADQVLSGRVNASVRQGISVAVRTIQSTAVDVAHSTARGLEVGIDIVNAKLETINTLADGIMSGKYSSEVKQAVSNLQTVIRDSAVIRNAPVVYEGVIQRVNNVLENLNTLEDAILSGRISNSVRQAFVQSVERLRIGIPSGYEAIVDRMNALVEPLNTLANRVMSGEVSSQLRFAVSDANTSVHNFGKYLADLNEAGITRVNHALENINTAADYVMSGGIPRDIKAAIRSFQYDVRLAEFERPIRSVVNDARSVVAEVVKKANANALNEAAIEQLVSKLNKSIDELNVARFDSELSQLLTSLRDSLLLPEAQSRVVGQGFALKTTEAGSEAIVWQGLKLGNKPILGVSKSKLVAGTGGIELPPIKDWQLPELERVGADRNATFNPNTALDNAVMINADALVRAGMGEMSAKLLVKRLNDSISTLKTFYGKKSPYMTSKFLTDPIENLTGASVENVMKYIADHPNQVERVYGSSTMRPQFKPEAYREWSETYGRSAGDIDINFRDGIGDVTAAQFIKDLAAEIQKGEPNSQVVYDPNNPLQVQLKLANGTTAKVLEAHYKGEPASALGGEEAAAEAARRAGSMYSSHKERVYGFEETSPTVTVDLPGVGKIKVARLSQTGVNKSTQVLGWRLDPGTGEIALRAAPQRLKDYVDLYEIISTYQGKDVATRWASNMGITDILDMFAEKAKVAEGASRVRNTSVETLTKLDDVRTNLRKGADIESIRRNLNDAATELNRLDDSVDFSKVDMTNMTAQEREWFESMRVGKSKELAVELRKANTATDIQNVIRQIEEHLKNVAQQADNYYNRWSSGPKDWAWEFSPSDISSSTRIGTYSPMISIISPTLLAASNSIPIGITASGDIVVITQENSLALPSDTQVSAMPSLLASPTPSVLVSTAVLGSISTPTSGVPSTSLTVSPKASASLSLVTSTSPSAGSSESPSPMESPSTSTSPSPEASPSPSVSTSTSPSTSPSISPSPSPSPKMSPVPDQTLRSPVKVALAGSSGQFLTRDEKREAFRGSVGWQQGRVIWAAKYPFKTKNDVAAFSVRYPPYDFTLVKGGPKSAYASIQAMYPDTVPEALSLRIGFVKATISDPEKSPGKAGALAFENVLGKPVTADIDVKGMGKNSPGAFRDPGSFRSTLRRNREAWTNAAAEQAQELPEQASDVAEEAQGGSRVTRPEAPNATAAAARSFRQLRTPLAESEALAAESEVLAFGDRSFRQGVDYGYPGAFRDPANFRSTHVPTGSVDSGKPITAADLRNEAELERIALALEEERKKKKAGRKPTIDERLQRASAKASHIVLGTDALRML